MNGGRIKSSSEGTDRGVPMTSPIRANAETRREVHEIQRCQQCVWGGEADNEILAAGRLALLKKKHV